MDEHEHFCSSSASASSSSSSVNGLMNVWVQNKQCTTCNKTSTRQRAVERVGTGPSAAVSRDACNTHFCPASVRPSIVARPRGPVAIGARRRAQNTNRRLMRIRHVPMTTNDDDDTYTYPRRSNDRSITRTDWTRKHVNPPPHRTGPCCLLSHPSPLALSANGTNVFATFSCTHPSSGVLGVESTPQFLWVGGFFARFGWV